MIYCPSCGHVAHTRRAHFMDDGTKIMIAQCRNIYCSATFEASESFFSDCKDSGMEYISGKQMRIPLYSITDWHRSPISDSHPFDQPGT